MAFNQAFPHQRPIHIFLAHSEARNHAISSFLLVSLTHNGHRVSTNPILSVNDMSGNNKLSGTVSASATPHLPLHGQVLTTHIQAPSSLGGSPPGLPHSMTITTCSIPATPHI